MYLEFVPIYHYKTHDYQQHIIHEKTLYYNALKSREISVLVDNDQANY